MICGSGTARLLLSERGSLLHHVLDPDTVYELFLKTWPDELAWSRISNQNPRVQPIGRGMHVEKDRDVRGICLFAIYGFRHRGESAGGIFRDRPDQQRYRREAGSV